MSILERWLPYRELKKTTKELQRQLVWGWRPSYRNVLFKQQVTCIRCLQVQSWTKVLGTVLQYSCFPVILFWGEGRCWTCVNWKMSQKCKSVPRLLCMIAAITTPQGGSKVLSLQITHPAQERLTTPSWSTSPTLSEQWCGFFYTPQEPDKWKCCETGPTVFRPYPRRLESLTICRCHYKGSTFFSVI